MKKPFYIVNAFGTDTFTGNPSGICWLGNDVLSEEQMLAVASEVNLSYIAFISFASGSFSNNSRFGIRWFTPTEEVFLSGHATLSAAHTLFEKANNSHDTLTFEAHKQEIKAFKDQEFITIEFKQSKPEAADEEIFQNLILSMFTPMERGSKIADVRISKKRKILLIRMTDDFSRANLEKLNPDFGRMRSSHDGSMFTGVVVTVKARPSEGYHFYSRYFSPWKGINEDPVSAISHSVLAPFWQASIGKREMLGKQCSKRGGDLKVSVRRDDIIEIRGTALVVDGVITIPDHKRLRKV